MKENRLRRPLWLALFCLVPFLPTPHVAAGEAYYLMMFGAQTVPGNPRYSHSFATFVRATWAGDGPCPTSAQLEAQTISWLPCDLDIRLLACPKCGNNLNLKPTLDYVRSHCERVSMWGPYEIECDLYYRALKQAGVLESGQVRYQASDAFRKPARVSNCIHALGAVEGGYRIRVASPGWGESASYTILRRFRPWILDETQSHTWVSSALGLDAYPIIYRDFENPRSGGIVGPVFRLLGAERDLRATYGPPVPN